MLEGSGRCLAHAVESVELAAPVSPESKHEPLSMFADRDGGSGFSSIGGSKEGEGGGAAWNAGVFDSWFEAASNAVAIGRTGPPTSASLVTTAGLAPGQGSVRWLG